MFFSERYNFLGLETGNLKVLWEFEPQSGNAIANGIENEFSGAFTGGADYYSVSGSGAFNGSAYAELFNYDLITAEEFCAFLLFDRRAAGDCILFSSYRTGETTTSGFTVGLNDNNKLYVHIEASGDNIIHTYDEITLGGKNLIVANYGGSIFSLGYCDLLSDNVKLQEIQFSTTHNFKSDKFYLGGNPAYESKFNIAKYSGYVDQFVYIDQALNIRTVIELLDGFKITNETFQFLYEIENSKETNRYVNLTGTLTNSGILPLSLAATGVSTFFSENYGSGLYSGSISGNIQTGNVSVTGNFRQIISGVPTGALIPYSNNHTGVTGAGYFNDTIYYINDDIENVVFTHVIDFYRPSIQPTEFKVFKDVYQQWTEVEHPVTGYLDLYNQFKMQGVTLFSGDGSNQAVLKTKVNPTLPSGINVLPIYNGVYGKFSTVSNHTDNIDLYVSGDLITGFTIANKIISIGDGFQPYDTVAVYDLQTGTNQSIASGAALKLTGEFFNNSSILFLDNKRLLLNSDYYETHSYDLLHNRAKRIVNPDTGVYSDLYWGYTGNINSGCPTGTVLITFDVEFVKTNNGNFIEVS